jgi:signal transduction histidine kinase
LTAQAAPISQPKKPRLTSLQAKLFASHGLVLLLALALVLLISGAYLRRLERNVEQQRLAQVAIPLTAEVNNFGIRASTAAGRTPELLAAIDAQAATMKIRLLILEADGTVWYDTAQNKPLTGTILGNLADPIAALLKKANKKDEVQTKILPGSDVIGGAENATALISAGPTGALKAKRALLILSPNRRFPLLALYLPRLLLVAGISLLAGAGVSFLLSRRIAEPVGQLTRAADAMAAGNLAQTVPGTGPDEIGRLVASFNSMSHRVASLAESQRDLLANVAHELRTPLTSVQGYARALKDGVIVDPGEQERALGTIGRESERMAALIGQLLDLARLESGQTQLTIGTVDAAGLLNQVAEQFRPAAMEKSIHLSVSTPEEIEIAGDEPRLVQIISNLVSNAIRHTQSGGRVSLLAAAVDGPPGPLVRLWVQDNGEGMTPEQVDHLFTRFARGAGSRVDDQTGFGLGLAIVKELVALHHGAIAVQSRLGEGSAFIIDLPAAPAA